MSRKYLIAGNWKMNKTAAQAVVLAKEIADKVGNDTSVDVAICPTFLSVENVVKTVASSAVKVGGQNLYPKAEGAYTGEVSPEMLAGAGCKYVILGHSERREYFKETDAFINEKVKAALASNLMPILCVGETLAEREADKTLAVIKTQMEGGLAGLCSCIANQIVIAYEPVWAIGTGKTATPEMAQEVHAAIREMLVAQFGEGANQIQILYGGSMKPENADELLAQKDIDGGLIGGAALKADSFMALITSAKNAK